MERKKMTFIAGLVILLGLWISVPFSESQAQSDQKLDLSGTLVQDRVRSSGIIVSQPLPTLGSIVGSQDERAHLSEGDLVYIRPAPGKRVKAGDRFSIARWGEEVIHPVTKEKLGHRVLVPGILVVLGGEGQTLPAKIDRSFAHIHYGDLLIPPIPVLPTSIPIRSSAKIKKRSSIVF